MLYLISIMWVGVIAWVYVLLAIRIMDGGTISNATLTWRSSEISSANFMVGVYSVPMLLIVVEILPAASLIVLLAAGLVSFSFVSSAVFAALINAVRVSSGIDILAVRAGPCGQLRLWLVENSVSS